jgi:Protein of unknown function (DUF2516)
VVGEVFGVDGLFIVVMGLVFFVVPIWALVDAISRPGSVFVAASSSKGFWIAMLLATWIITGIVGVILAIVYLTSIRRRLKAVMVQLP